MKLNSKREKNIFRFGFLAGLRKNKNKKNTNIKQKNNKSKSINKKNTSKSIKNRWYFFKAFNDNCDVFGVAAEGSSRKDALARARGYVHNHPKGYYSDVEVTNDDANPDDYAMLIQVKKRGG